MPRQRSAQPRYRRRVVLELTADESAVLDRLADRLGTIRGAVLAGLQELEADRSAELAAQATALAERLAGAERAAQAERERAEGELASLREELVEGRQALQDARAQTKQARADLRASRARLKTQVAARRAADEAQRAAHAALIRHAYCAACDRLVPEAEWAEERAQQGVYGYHRPHGLRSKGGGLLGQPASLLYWRARPRAGVAEP